MARLVDAVLGLEKQKQILYESLMRDQLAHVYLFSGPEGIGKKQLATAMAQSLLCSEKKDGCGQCPSCHRVEKLSHEGLLIIEPELGHVIKIEKSREILDFLSLKSLSKNRVIIIDHAHLLNPQAANSLLKIIEEPPVGTYFFLITHNASLVLSTIRSRSRTVRFQTLTTEQLKLKNPSAPEWALKAARGSFKKMNQLIDSEEISERAICAQYLDQFLFEPDFLLSNDWRSYVKEKTGFTKLIYYWLSIIRDAIYLKSDEQDSILNLDLLSSLKKMQKVEKLWLLEMMNQLISIETHQMINRDPQFVFEELWILLHKKNIEVPVYARMD